MDPNSPSKPVHPHTLEQVPGITMREYAAVHIYAAIAAALYVRQPYANSISGAAIEGADFLIKELQK